MKYCVVILSFLFICIISNAQKNYVVNYTPIDADNNTLTSTLTNTFPNQLQCKTYLDKLTTTLQLKGFATASVDSVAYGKDTATVTLFFGKKYQWQQLDINGLDTNVLLKSGWNNKQFTKQLTYESITATQQKLLNYYQENGYPFAKISIDSVQVKEDKISAKLQVDKGYLHRIDSVRVIGTAKISNIFLQKFLQIKNGSLYKKSLLDNIPKKLQQLAYLEQQSNYNFTMLPSASVVNLYLKPRKSSIINVLLGVIPAPNPNGLQNAPQSKLFLSGDANILLNNALTFGETIGLTYQQLSINSRRINLLYKHPYIFKSNYSLETAFELYKRDSSYLNLEANIGAVYSLGDNKTAKIFLQQLRTNTYPDTSVIKFTKKLPDNLDVKIYNIGLQYEVNTTDYRRNPRTGNECTIIGSFGTKKIFKNSGITDIRDISFNYSKLYDTIKLNTYQIKLKTTAAHYIKLKKQTVLKLALQGGLLLSQNYFRNELFQIGGFKILRGFDEESQFCNQYAVATTEWRYLIGGDSYFFAFVDGAYTNYKIQQSIQHTYIGTGLGLSFASKAGLFNISFAVGARNDIALGFRQAKLHFGYVTVF